MAMSVTSATAAVNPWMRILDALEKKINRHSYDTWLKPTRFSHSNEHTLFVLQAQGREAIGVLREHGGFDFRAEPVLERHEGYFSASSSRSASRTLAAFS